MSSISLEKINGLISCALLGSSEPTLEAVRAYVIRALGVTALDERADAAVRAAHASQRHAYILSECKEELALHMESCVSSFATELPGGPAHFLQEILAPEPLHVLGSLGVEEKNELYEELDIFRSQYVHGRMQLDEQNMFGSQLADWLKSGEPTKVWFPNRVCTGATNLLSRSSRNWFDNGTKTAEYLLLSR